MKRSFLAGALSLVIPGLGQIYRGRAARGGAILAAAIIIGNLNIIILPLISLANPVIPPPTTDVRVVWAYYIPRIVHDVVSMWSIVFWLWAVVDAFRGWRDGDQAAERGCDGFPTR